MSDIEDELIAGESIVTRTTKHWISPLVDSKWAILAIIGALILAWLQSDQVNGIMGFFNRVMGLAQLALVLGGLGSIVYNIVAWRTADFAVTSQRIVGHEGLLRQRNYDTLLTSVADVRSTVPALGRALGYGNLRIISASGDAGAYTLSAIRGVDAFKKSIVEQKTGSATAAVQAIAQASAASVSAPAAVAAAPAVSASADAMATLESLARLRDTGAITPEEFEAKKTELMARI